MTWMTSWTSSEAAHRPCGACQPSCGVPGGGRRPAPASRAALVRRTAGAPASTQACAMQAGSRGSSSSSSSSSSNSQSDRYRRWRQYCCSQSSSGSSSSFGILSMPRSHPLSKQQRTWQPPRLAVAASASSGSGSGSPPQQGETLADVMGNIMQQLMAMQQQAAGSGSRAAHLHVTGLGYQPPGGHCRASACGALGAPCLHAATAWQPIMPPLIHTAVWSSTRSLPVGSSPEA